MQEVTMKKIELPEKVLPFKSLSYERPNLPELSDAFRRCRLRVRLAGSTHAAANAVFELQPHLQSFHLASCLANSNYDLDLTNSYWQAEVEFFLTAKNQILVWTEQTYAALMSSRFAEQLQILLGQALFSYGDMLKKSVDESILADLNEESRLIAAHERKRASLIITIAGRKYSLSSVKPQLFATSDFQRRDSFRAVCRMWQDEHVWFDNCLDELIAVRHKMSKKLNYKSFSQLAYKRLGRSDYGRKEVRSFRKLVRKYLVPVNEEIHRLQRQRLGLRELFYWNGHRFLVEGNPQPRLGHDEWLPILAEQIAKLFGDSSWLNQLVESGYVNFKANDNKASGAYCRFLHEKNLPLVFTNSTGTTNDLIKLIHESGHAFAALIRSQHAASYEEQNSSCDLKQVQATAFEYLLLPQLESVFADELETVVMIHLLESLLFLPYACLVDHFQHELYDRPEMTAAQRRVLWRRLEKIYQPTMQYGDDLWFEQGGSWYQQPHIFARPFYYIEYALAHLAALQIWSTGRKDEAEAARQYYRLCTQTESLNYIELLKAAGIDSPFEEATFKKTIYAVCDYLEL